MGFLEQEELAVNFPVYYFLEDFVSEGIKVFIINLNKIFS